MRLPDPLVDQIKRVSASFQIELPIYWANLAALLGRLLNQVFDHYGKNMDAVKEAVSSVVRSLDFAQYEMCSRIRGAVLALHAEEFGHTDVAAYVRRFEGIEEEKLVRKICQIVPNYDLAYVGIQGKRSGKILDAAIYLPITSPDDRLMLQMTSSPEEMITHHSWYCWCLPQILGHFLQWSAFRDTKPIHELDYAMGFSLEDYDRVGLA
jgi:hypothetical protein